MIEHRRLLIAIVLLVAFLLQLPLFAEDAQYHFRKGHKFYLESKPDEAELEFKKAVQLNNKLYNAHYYLGSIYFKQRRYDQAIHQCKQALLINSEDLKSLIILGLSLHKIGMDEEAMQTFLRARDVDNHSPAVHSALGLAYCTQGDIVKARGQYIILKKMDAGLAEDLLQRIEKVK